MTKRLPTTTMPGSKTPVVAVPVVLIDASNAKKLLVDSGFHPAASVAACK